MVRMTDENFQKLAIQWPELFEKAHIDHIECGDGWYDIIYTLCDVISSEVTNLSRKIKYLTENSPEFDSTELKRQLELSIELLPTIQQVKEKFGTLRFYVDYTTDRVDNYIEFAERMSAKTCEVCGNPGTMRSTRWLKVLCDEHYKQYNELDDN